jgi:hypothetical protein
MTSRERIDISMHLDQPDRVPVMCQLSIGHYFLQSGVTPFDIWFTSEGFAQALVRMQKRYRFDGILVNLPGRDPAVRQHIHRIEEVEGETIVRWMNGNITRLPHNDNPHYYQTDKERSFPLFENINPDELYYIEPWDLTGISYPFMWGFEAQPRSKDHFFPDFHFDTIQTVQKLVGSSVSVHSEIFSPWSQFLELLNHENALLAIIEDAEKVKACLERLSEGAIDLATRQAALGIDAILISSAFAGAGFISRRHYEEFVLPYERRVINGIHERTDIPLYTHTCGSIGDRLDLMLETGTNGIDTLDPPPLGTVELEEAKRILSGRAFIKGNVDPVNTLLNGTIPAIRQDVHRRLQIAAPGGGYILSTACSVAPQTPPENIEILHEMAERYGR